MTTTAPAAEDNWMTDDIGIASTIEEWPQQHPWKILIVDDEPDRALDDSPRPARRHLPRPAAGAVFRPTPPPKATRCCKSTPIRPSSCSTWSWRATTPA